MELRISDGLGPNHHIAYLMVSFLFIIDAPPFALLNVD
jgi:hypothetical protein